VRLLLQVAQSSAVYISFVMIRVYILCDDFFFHIERHTTCCQRYSINCFQKNRFSECFKGMPCFPSKKIIISPGNQKMKKRKNKKEKEKRKKAKNQSQDRLKKIAKKKARKLPEKPPYTCMVCSGSFRALKSEASTKKILS
jgi:hypothetical protein